MLDPKYEALYVLSKNSHLSIFKKSLKVKKETSETKYLKNQVY